MLFGVKTVENNYKVKQNETMKQIQKRQEAESEHLHKLGVCNSRHAHTAEDTVLQYSVETKMSNLELLLCKRNVSNRFCSRDSLLILSTSHFPLQKSYMACNSLTIQCVISKASKIYTDSAKH